ncbi:hypothetical protein CC86DRAFT_442317 [Ophiobolus disseminans]|uniref:CFEM domain-containing protein n=1 Tax=Ophiobolus disseminans TaxID=1469910 RepID=A0A6A7AFG0_9PLEO|nr:hypothetical protein CC86DRAFT_442317 [Ophiobolus disseminans]
MRPLTSPPPLAPGLPKIFLPILLLAAHISPGFSIPQPLYGRQSSFAALQLPQCALPCFLKSILTDGCASETDFACHCGAGNIVGEATACIEQGCSKNDEAEAFGKMSAACGAIGGRSMSGGGSSTTMSSTTRDGAGSSTSGLLASASSQSSASLASSSQRTPAPNPSRTPTPSPPSTLSSRPSPTSPPLSLLPPSSQLSPGAKAGLSVSLSLLALSIFLALGWYIRRLKRALLAAQTLSDDVWRASMDTVTAPAVPGSRGMEEFISVQDNGYGVLKKKRGHVLSVVVEGEEEGRPESVGVDVWEPVPGQREGLAGPLEMEGESWRSEMPLSVTPRERSLER